MGFKKFFSRVFAIVMMFALMSAAVSAVDLAPIVSLSENFDRTTTTLVLTAVASDVLDNAGLAWIKLYEDGILIEEKDCEYSRTCTLTKVVVKTAPEGVYTYRADAYDRGGNIKESNEVNVTFAGVDWDNPEFSNIHAVPASPAPYGLHSLRATWTDNGRIRDVYIEHNFWGNVAKVPVTGNTGDEYYYNIDFVELGQYQWRMIAEDAAEQGPNVNQTPWQTYEVVRADPNVNWSALPSATEPYLTQTTVGCVIDPSYNDETVLTMYRNGVEVSNPDVATLGAGVYTYECNGTQTDHYNAVSKTFDLTITRIAPQLELLLNTLPADLASVERLFDTVDMEGQLVTGENGLELYIDGVEVANGSSPVSYATNFNLTGTYNVTVVSPETANYSRLELTRFVTVFDTIPPDMVSPISATDIDDNEIVVEWTYPSNDDFAGAMVYLDNVHLENVTGAPGANETYDFENLTFNTPYNITVHTFDVDGNINTTDQTLLVSTAPDTTAPDVWTNEVNNETYWDGNQTFWVGNWTFGDHNDAFAVAEASDAFLMDVWFEHNFGDGVTFVNETASYDNSSRYYYVNASALPAGSYSWRLHANDTSGNENATAWVGLEVAGAPASCTLSFNETSPVPYGTAVEINGSCTNPEATPVLTRNGVDVTLAELNQVVVLPAGEWEYNISTPLTQNYSAASYSENFTVTKLPSAVNLTLDGAKADVNGVETFLTVNVSAEKLAGEGDIEVLENGAQLYLGQGPFNDPARAYSTAGTYNITLVYAETQNYTASSETYFVNVAAINRTFTVPTPSIAVVPPDTNATVAIEINNSGNVDDSYTMAITNAGGIDVSALNDTATAVMVPGETLAFELTAQDNDTGAYNLEVYVESVTDPNVNVTVPVTVVVADFSHIVNSWVFGTYYADTLTTSITQLIGATVVDSTVTNTDTNINISEVHSSTVDNSYILDYSNITGSTVTGSVVRNSVFGSGTVTDSTVENVAASTGFTVDYSYVGNSDVTGSTITGGSTVADSDVLSSTITNTSACFAMTVDQASIVENSNIADSIIRNSVVRDSTFSCAYILNSRNTVINSDVTGSTLDNATVINSTATHSNLTNAGVTNGAVVTNSTVADSAVDAATVTGGSNIVNSASVTSGAVVDGSTVDGATVEAGSSVLEGSVVDGGSVVTGGSVVEGGATVTAGSTIDNSNINGATIDNSAVTNSSLLDVTLVNGEVTNDVFVSGTMTLSNGTVITGSGQNLTDVINYAPNAVISASATTITEGGSVTFSSASTDANIGTALNDSLTFLWYFGDGTNSTSGSPGAHGYGNDGTYIVTLIVTDKFGAVDTAYTTITVNPKSSSSSSSGGGGGGGSRSSARIVSLLDLQPGGFATLNLYQGDRVRVKYDNIDYTLHVMDIAYDHTDFHVEPTGIDVTVQRYLVKNINLNGDIYNDLSINMNRAVGSREAEFTIGLKEKPTYDPIYIPGPQPEPEPEPEVEPEPEPQPEPEPEAELSLWQKIVAWFKGLFSSDEDEVDTSADITFGEPDEPEEQDENQTMSLWQRVASWFGSDGSDEEADAEVITGAAVAEDDSEPDSTPGAVLGWFLAILVVALIVAGYFVFRQKAMDKMLDKYLK